MVRRRKICCALVALIGLVGRFPAFAEAGKSDHVKILTNHNPSLVNEFARGFEAYYQKRYKREVRVEWLDQGGPARNIQYLQQVVSNRSKSVPVDIVWGGGVSTFQTLANMDALETLKLNKTLLSSIENLSIPSDQKFGKGNSWVVSALAGFGILVNWATLKEKTTDLGTGAHELSLQSLTLPGFKDLIVVLDPRKSSSFAAVCSAIVRANGWDTGLQLIESYFVGSKTIARNSEVAVDAVSRGEIGATFADDYLALEQMLNGNRPELEYTNIANPSELRSDPIAIVRRSENQETADRFVQFVLSKEGQGLLQLNKGTPGGPTAASLARISVRPEISRLKSQQLANSFNPFAKDENSPAHLPGHDAPPDLLATLIGVIYVDQHQNWRRFEEMNPPRNAHARREVWLGVAFLPKGDDVTKLIELWNKDRQRDQIIDSWRKSVADYFDNRLRPVPQ